MASQSNKPMFEASWERLDSLRSPQAYQVVEEDGQAVTLLRQAGDTMQQLTEEEVSNIEKAAEQMNDRED